VAYLSLPDTQRSLTELMRSVRPQLVARLEAEAKSRLRVQLNKRMQLAALQV